MSLNEKVGVEAFAWGNTGSLSFKFRNHHVVVWWPWRRCQWHQDWRLVQKFQAPSVSAEGEESGSDPSKGMPISTALSVIGSDNLFRIPKFVRNVSLHITYDTFCVLRPSGWSRPLCWLLWLTSRGAAPVMRDRSQTLLHMLLQDLRFVIADVTASSLHQIFSPLRIWILRQDV